MPLRFPDPPSESVRELSTFLQRFDRGGTAGATFSIMAEGVRGQPQRTLPHAVFSVELQDLIGERPLAESAKQVGWRYLLPQGGDKISAAHVAQENDTHSTPDLNDGPFVRQTADLIAEVAADPMTASADFEVRVLLVPQIYVFALWLHRADVSDDDVFVPMGPTATILRVRRRYRRREFEAALATLARERLRFLDEP